MRHLNRACFIFLLIWSFSASALLQPAIDTVDAPTNDPFLICPWALFHRGQKTSVLLDHNTAHEIKAAPAFSLHWRNFDPLMKRDAVMAIIDSGVDLKAPELQNALLKGFNTLGRTERLLTFPDDDKGHGTHLASIVAAASNDGQGMSGLSNRIKIIPIKVYDSREAPNATGRKALLERLVIAMEYAIQQKVDVINLSMGWPRAKDASEVEAVFKKAIDAGIVVIAAAGNDGHEALIYPCAYRGVICVGAIDMDGSMADYSNFGGHVDMLAPGQEILGLWPTENAPPSLVSVPKGFELMTGTSQAAPMVAATAAIMRGIHPDEPSWRLRHRLLQSAKRVVENKNYSSVRFGLLDMETAVNQPAAPFLAPVFKGVEMVGVNPRTLEFGLAVELEASPDAKTPKVEIESLTEGVSFEKLRPVGSGRYQVNGKLTDLNLTNRLRYRVKLDGVGFEHQILMATDLLEAHPQRLPLPEGRLLPIGDSRGVRLPKFWSFDETNDGLVVKVWSWTGREWVKRETTLSSVNGFLPDIGMGMVVGNWLGDGQDVYLLAGKKMGLADQKGVRPIEAVRFIYLDRDLKVLRDLKMIEDLDQNDRAELPAFRRPEEIILGRASDGQGGSLQVPLFWRKGRIPKADQNPDYFAFEKNQDADRLYFLQPKFQDGEWVFQTRLINSWALEGFFRKTYDLPARSRVQVIGLKTQGKADLASGRNRLLVFAGRGVEGKVHEINVQDLLEPFSEKNVQTLRDDGIDLTGGALREALRIDANGEVDRTTEMQTLYSFVSGRSLFEDGLGMRVENFSIPVTGESLVTTLKSVVRGSDQLTLLESSDFVRAKGIWNGKKVDSKILTYRSTFLPGHLFSQIYVPVLVGESQYPGLMMDNSQFFSRSVSVYALNEAGEMESPVRLSFQIPTGCNVGGRLALWNEKNFSQIMLRCQKPGAKEIELMLVDLK